MAITPSITRTAKMGVFALICNCLALIAASDVMAQGKNAPIRIVAFGDSLSAGFRLVQSDSFPAQLAAALTARGHAVEVINAGVSGDTTAAGRERLAWSVPPGTEAVIVELGANDMLRGLDPRGTRDNLDAILRELKKLPAEVLVAGMRAPKNLGDRYQQDFDRIFPELAATHGALLYPFFIERIVLKPELNLDDGLHPNARGVAVIVADIMPKVEELIARVIARRSGQSG